MDCPRLGPARCGRHDEQSDSGASESVRLVIESASLLLASSLRCRSEVQRSKVEAEPAAPEWRRSRLCLTRLAATSAKRLERASSVDYGRVVRTSHAIEDLQLDRDIALELRLRHSSCGGILQVVCKDPDRVNGKSIWIVEES